MEISKIVIAAEAGMTGLAAVGRLQQRAMREVGWSRRCPGSAMRSFRATALR
jgi:hypothetical protein